jgi:diadenosine tetraphosphate (Ap4A) HIT family hydrolase
MSKCPFCRIIKKPETEKYRIISTEENCIVMLTLNPETRGHLLVFPKKHFDKISDIPNSGQLFERVVDMAEEAVKKLGAPAYTIKMNNQLFLLEKDKLHVGHIHFHVIPRYSSGEMKNPPPDKATPTDLSSTASLLKI